ncbi:MAG: LiaF-related protein [candidate division KSB1 bacterium]|nr:LiaF-related protein [candidate division KSB1 bacterium]
MARRHDTRGRPSTLGIILIVLGVLLLLDQMGVMDFEDFVQTFWPLILILIGLKMIFFPKEKPVQEEGVVAGPPRARVAQVESEEHIDEQRILGEIRRKIQSQNFVGAKYSVTFGDIDLDCRDMTLSPGQRTLFLSVVFGDIRLQLPERVPYLVRASVSAGEAEVGPERGSGLFIQRTLKSADFDSATTRLIIVASTVFGDIKIW